MKAASTHLDFAWQFPEQAAHVAIELESALKQALPHIGGMVHNPVWEANHSHQKMRVTITVEIVEDFS